MAAFEDLLDAVTGHLVLLASERWGKPSCVALSVNGAHHQECVTYHCSRSQAGD